MKLTELITAEDIEKYTLIDLQAGSHVDPDDEIKDRIINEYGDLTKRYCDSLYPSNPRMSHSSMTKMLVAFSMIDFALQKKFP